MTRKLNGPVLDGGFTLDRVWYKDRPIQGDPDYIHFFEDFVGIAVDLTNDWTEIEDAGASIAIEGDTLGGRILMSTGANDNEGTSIQGNEIFAVAAGRQIWFETKINLLDATESEYCSGLTINFATNPEAILTAADRIVFEKLDGVTDIQCITEFSGVETRTDSQIDIVAATDITLGFRVVGDSTVLFYVDRVLVATHTTNIVNDQNLCVAAFVLAGDAAGTTLAIDYLSVTMER
ncbi:MAG: hypothetical protein V3T23_03135 [Nitrososphaerales archaeon]